jgi:branched-chain amino acid transport system permease protein
MALGIYFALQLGNSRVGRAMASLRQNEAAAQAMGINVAYYKTMAMGLSGLYAGVAGALFGHMLNFLGPESFSLGQAIYVLVIVTLGGVASIWGTVAATIFMSVFREIIRSYSDVSVMVYGLLIMFVMAVAPTGAAGVARAVARRIRDRLADLPSIGPGSPMPVVGRAMPTREDE